MARLYPPYIEGTIPAFYTTDEGTFLKVPFSMNKTVSVSEINHFELKLKTLNGSVKGTVTSSAYDAISGMYVVFDLTKDLQDNKFQLTVGSYYKVQIAYRDKKDNEIGYYSTVGITKYTTKPNVQIKNLSDGQLNEHCYDYTGVYSQQGGDVTEKLYSSYFILSDSNNNIIYQSPEKPHDNTTDDLRYEATELFQYKKDFPKATSYFIQFFIKTTNLLEQSSPKYRIIQQTFAAPDYDFNLLATLDFNNGCMELSLTDYNKNYLSGSFSLKRASSLNDWTYEEIQKIYLQNVDVNHWKYIDYNIEHGAKYRYSIQQFNSRGVYSNKIYSNEIYSEFEDSFLFDGERQLRVRYNPKVSSFKVTIQEQKTDTIGNQFPYFTRNSHIYYKEFPISGLISYLMDENEYFVKKSELNYYGPTTNLTSENITTERLFKMKVLEWLNNGEPKIFRSPTEGNFLVRLMNVSLSPNDTLSRMLHTFSCTAYEIGKYNVESLDKYKLSTVVTGSKHTIYESINIFDAVDNALRENKGKTRLEWAEGKQNGTINFETELQAYIQLYGKWFPLHSGTELLSIHLTDLMPGTEIKINSESTSDECIVIGVTQSYFFEMDPVKPTEPVTSVKYNLDYFPQGIFTYTYESKDMAIDTFQLVNNVKIEDVPCQQFIGTSYYQVITSNASGGTYSYTESNIINTITNVKEKITQVNLLRLYKRPIIDAYIVTDPQSPMTFEEIITKIKNRNYTDLLINIYPKDDYPELRPYDDEEPFYQLSLDQSYRFLSDQTDIMPLYQLRMPRSDYREQWDYFHLLVDANLMFYSAENYQPYTFEGYYANRVLDNFAPCIGYFFDPATGRVFKATNNTFSAKINGTTVDVREVETYNYNVTEETKINSIVLKEGVCCEFGYFKSISHYIFEEPYNRDSNEALISQREAYENSIKRFLLMRNGMNSTGGDIRLENYISSFLPYSSAVSFPGGNSFKLVCRINGDDNATITNFLENGSLQNYYRALDTRSNNIEQGALEERSDSCARGLIDVQKQRLLTTLNNRIEQYFEENNV